MYVVPQGGYAPQNYARPQAAAPTAPPKVRFQKPDDPPASERRPENSPVALTLPPPEQLGIGGATAAGDIDLNALNHRLDELGAESSEWRRTPDGYHFTCVLANADLSRKQTLEGRGATRADAARQLLARAEQWAQGK